MENREPKSVGNYDIVRWIAEGGMGTVYQGRHKLTGQIVAIKILSSAMAKNAVLLQRFEREFRAASQLDHPNIVRAIEYCKTWTSPFLAMEFVEGQSIGKMINPQSPMREDRAIDLITQVCLGLEYAHDRELIHRDVKPDNILVTPDGVAKLTDFGLVKDSGEMNLTVTGRGLGTPYFMAPEQFRNAKNADIRYDIYSVGATLYAMLTGQLPFDGCGPLDCWMKKDQNDFPYPKELVSAISDRTDKAIRRAMSAKPENRPASCKEFVADLMGKVVRSQPTAAQPVTADLWYLVYRDEEDKPHTVKGTTESILRALEDGLLGDAQNIRAANSKQGPFKPLKNFPVFGIPKKENVGGASSGSNKSVPIPAEKKPTTKQNVPVEQPKPITKQSTVPDPLQKKETDWFVWILVAMMGIASLLIGYMLLKSE